MFRWDFLLIPFGLYGRPFVVATKDVPSFTCKCESHLHSNHFNTTAWLCSCQVSSFKPKDQPHFNLFSRDFESSRLPPSHVAPQSSRSHLGDLNVFDPRRYHRDRSRSVQRVFSSTATVILRQIPNEMATPALADDVVIKSTTSDPAIEEQPALEDEHVQEEDGPAHLPLSTREQLQAMSRRREAAVSFKHQVSECRLALRYSVIGWTGTLDPVSRKRLSPLSLSVENPSWEAPVGTHHPPTSLPINSDDTNSHGLNYITGENSSSPHERPFASEP